MNITNAIATVKAILAGGSVPYLHGAPGIGKSEIVAQIAHDMGVDLIDVRVAQMDPTDLRGIPSVTDGETVWNTPAFWPRSGRGILFLDELSSAPPAVQVPVYQLIRNGRIGEYQLPAGWQIVAAGNRAEDRSVVKQLSAALADRFMHVDVDADVDAWQRWALDADVFMPIIAFVRFRPELLHAFDPSVDPRSFPTPRSWVMVSDVLKATPDLPPEIELDLIAGTLGMGAAAEFVGFMKIWRTLPDLDAIILNPDAAEIPSDPSTQCAIAAGLARKMNVSTVDAALRYLGRMSGEFAAMALQMATVITPEITATRGYIDWATRNDLYK